MTRSILLMLAVSSLVLLFAGPGCSQGGVGDPCVPDQEYDTCFAGFDPTEVNVESKSFQCQTRVCLVNHFQGRVSCPYGQSAGTENLCPSGNAANCGAPPSDVFKTCGVGTTGGPPYSPPPGGKTTCAIPGGATLLDNATTSIKTEYQVEVTVKPQILSRNTANAVYCSCRCANANGQTNDGSVYCSCPDGYDCEPLVNSIGTGLDNGLTGSYCIKHGSQYDPNAPTTETCDPNNPATQCP